MGRISYLDKSGCCKFVYLGSLHNYISKHWIYNEMFRLRWEKPGHSPLFGYDFWYQPRHKTMIGTSWGAPSAFTKGFDLQHVSDGLYGRHHLHVYSWPEGELKQTLDLGNTGLLPLEIRFLHDPSKDTGFVGCALTSNMVRFFKTAEGSWNHGIAFSVKPLKVQNWIIPEMPGLITDFLLSLDDRYLYMDYSCFNPLQSFLCYYKSTNRNNHWFT